MRWRTNGELSEKRRMEQRLRVEVEKAVLKGRRPSPEHQANDPRLDYYLFGTIPPMYPPQPSRAHSRP